MKPGCLPKKRASGGAWVDQNGFGMLPYYWILIDCRAADADTGRTKREALSGSALLRQARRQCSMIVPTVCTLEGAADAGACFRRRADGIVRRAALVQQPFDVGQCQFKLLNAATRLLRRTPERRPQRGRAVP
jgi:hypothetical protein